MKTILLLLTILCCIMAVSSCTNEEGEDLDVINPNDEEEQFLLNMQGPSTAQKD